jgi:hypothetical protein
VFNLVKAGAAAILCGLATAPLADPLPVWKSAMISGSQRLSFFSLLKTKPRGYQLYMKRLMRNDGLLHRPGQGPQKLLSYAGLKPLIGYDTNINNGLPGEEFNIGKFTFRTDEEDRAKAGMTVGAMATGGLLYSVAPGHVLKFAAYGSYEYAPEHGLSKHAYGASACLGSHVAAYTWIDSCAGVRVAEKENASVEEVYASLGGSQAFATRFGHHEAKWAVKRSFRDDYNKTYVNAGVLSALADVGAIYAGVSWGEEIDGKHTSRWGASASITRSIMKRKTTFSISYGNSGGGYHFGTEREDDQYAVNVKSHVHKNVALSVGYSWSNSNIDFYDDNSVLFGVDIRSIQF